MGMTKKELNEYKKEKGKYHKSDPRHPMNAELTGPSVTIAIMPLPKSKPTRKTDNKKAEMAYGGMSGGKKHNYAAGGMVQDNPGLKALKAASPEAYNKIIGK
jgi:hypothetical protein